MYIPSVDTTKGVKDALHASAAPLYVSFSSPVHVQLWEYDCVCVGTIPQDERWNRAGAAFANYVTLYFGPP